MNALFRLLLWERCINCRTRVRFYCIISKQINRQGETVAMIMLCVIWSVYGRQTKQELSKTYPDVSISLFACKPSHLTTYPRPLCILLCQPTISPFRSISGPMTAKAKGSDLLDRVPTDNTFRCHIHMLCSRFNPMRGIWPWDLTFGYKAFVCLKRPSCK